MELEVYTLLNLYGVSGWGEAMVLLFPSLETGFLYLQPARAVEVRRRPGIAQIFSDGT